MSEIKAVSEIKGVNRFKFHEGKVEEFKRLSAQAMDIVRAKDTGTLQYEIYFNEDQSECVVYSDTGTPRRSSSTARTLATSTRRSLRQDRFPANSLVSRAPSSPRGSQAAESPSSGPSCPCRDPLTGSDERAPGSVDIPPHRSVRSGTDSRIGIRR